MKKQLQKKLYSDDCNSYSNQLTEFKSKARETKAVKFAVLVCLFVLMSFSSALASHFRFGLITATRLSETTTTVTYRLNVTTAWRIGSVGAQTFQFSITGGNSGSVNVPMTVVTDPSGGWTNSNGTANVTLNKSPIPTRISWSICCRISDLVNNRDAVGEVYTILNTNSPGSTPVSTLPAIINMPINATAATYTIPASDPDAGSTLTFGYPNLSTGPLAGQSLPNGFSLNPITGQITMNTVGKTVGQLYNAMVTVKDNNGNEIMLDFIIRMVGASTAPVFDYGVMPTDGQVFNVIAGQNITFPIKATDSDLGSSVSLSVSGLPAYITGSNFSPAFPATGNPALTTFSWTPASAQIGNTVILNFIATDNVGVQSSTSVTIRVVAEPAPVFVTPSPINGSVRQIETGVQFQDVIRAQSTLGSNVSIAFASGIPASAALSPAVPTIGANPGETILNWTPTPADFGVKNLSYQATISSIPTIFSTLSYQLIVNTKPQFTSTPITSAVVGIPYSYTINVSDPDLPFGDVLDITAANLPVWLTLVDNGNGTATLSGTPLIAGLNPIHLHAEDLYHQHGPGHHVGQEFDINVELPCNTVLSFTKTDVNCAGGSDGSVDLIVTGGKVPFTYSWSNGATSEDLLNVPAGSYTVTVTDANNCEETTTVTVGTIQDVTNPTITAPAPVSVNTDQGSCEATGVALGNPTASDNCPSVTVTNNAPSSFPKGTTTVTWTATDAAGNTETATQLVTVTDGEKPTISAPAAVAANTDNGSCEATNVTLGNATADDNCSGVIVTNDAPASFVLGTTTVTWMATDDAGNTETATQLVTVTDIQAPTVITKNYSVNLVNGVATITEANVNDGSNDACGIAYVGLDKTSFDCSNIGANIVTLTVRDNNGNTNTGIATVTVNGNIPSPQVDVTLVNSGAINAGNNKLIFLGHGSQQAKLNATNSNGACTYKWSGPPGLSNLNISNPVFTPTVEGIYTFTVEATSASGCKALSTETITVIDAVCGNKGDKVMVCHNGKEICVAANGVQALMNQSGTSLGSCNPVLANVTRMAAPASTPATIVETSLKAYPNPFSTSTKVEFTLAADGKYKADLIDMKGQLVSVLAEGEATAGTMYSRELNRSGLANGIYLVRLVSASEVKYLKLMLDR